MVTARELDCVKTCSIFPAATLCVCVCVEVVSTVVERGQRTATTLAS